MWAPVGVPRCLRVACRGAPCPRTEAQAGFASARASLRRRYTFSDSPYR